MILASKIIYLNELGGRGNLEDDLYPPPGTATEKDNLFLVCDGVGGENKGEVASHIAVTEFPVFFKESPPGEEFDTDIYLGNAQIHVLNEMRKYAEVHPDAIKMSTTLTLAYFTEKGILTAWCGDSRIYHLRNGKVLWQSTDHSLVAKLVERGEITEHEAINHAQRNIIIRSLSASGKAAVIETKWLSDIEENDYLMMCTDGVLENIDDQKLEAILTDPNEDKKSLFMNYCSGKTKDNFSLYLLKLSVRNPATPAANKPPKARTTFPTLLFVIVLLIAAASVYLWINYFDVNFERINIFKSHKATTQKKELIKNDVSGKHEASQKKDSSAIIPPAIPKKEKKEN